MKIEIKNRFNGSIILCGEYESVADCINKNSSADLRSADLRSADLRYADLFGEKITKVPLMVYGLNYDILITENHIKIGCEVHKSEEWKEFDDKRILEMDGKSALLWWKENKDFVIMCHEKHIA